MAVHPGVVSTDLTRYMQEKWHYKLLMKTIGGPLIKVFGKTPIEGAQTSQYCALEEFDKLVPGGY